MDKAYFLHHHAMEFYWDFTLALKSQFILKERDPDTFKLECNLKSNIKRIAVKIKEEGADGEYKITDMVRATIIGAEAAAWEGRGPWRRSAPMREDPS